MIVVTMGDRNEIETLQVNAKHGCVIGEVGALAPCVEENAPAAMLDEYGIPPSPFKVRGFAKCIEKYSDLGCAFL